MPELDITEIIPDDDQPLQVTMPTADEITHENVKFSFYQDGTPADIPQDGKVAQDNTLYLLQFLSTPKAEQEDTAGYEKCKEIITSQSYEPAAYTLTDCDLTPLMLAAANGYTEFTTLIAEQHPGAVVRKSDANGFNAMYLAAIHGHLGVMKALHTINPILARDFVDPDINADEPNAVTCLHIAAMNNHPDIIRWLVNESGISGQISETFIDEPVYLQEHAYNAENSLMLAIKIGNFEAVDTLLECGANVDYINEHMWYNPMYAACEKDVTDKNIAITQRLLEEGPELEVEFIGDIGTNLSDLPKESILSTAINTAGRCYRSEVVELLLRVGANPNHLNREKKPPLANACQYRIGKNNEGITTMQKVSHALLSFGADPNAVYEGDLALLKEDGIYTTDTSVLRDVLDTIVFYEDEVSWAERKPILNDLLDAGACYFPEDSTGTNLFDLLDDCANKQPHYTDGCNIVKTYLLEHQKQVYGDIADLPNGSINSSLVKRAFAAGCLEELLQKSDGLVDQLFGALYETPDWFQRDHHNLLQQAVGRMTHESPHNIVSAWSYDTALSKPFAREVSS